MSIPAMKCLRFAQIGVLGAVAMFAVAAPASAQRFVSEGPRPDDPVLEWAEQLAPRNQFYINNDEDVEVIRFKTPRDLELCAGRKRVSSDGELRNYAIKAMWDDQTAIIAPGNCLAIDAMQVRVRAASRLPENIILTGTFRVIK